jgi:hemerythrin-like metal-binding protein
MNFVWNDALETGIRQIDCQHQELIDLINGFESAHQEGRGATMLEGMLANLMGYAKFHFSTEEHLMLRPGTRTHATHHMAEHREFEERVKSMKANPSGDAAQDVTELIDYLKQWLLHHIMNTDMALAKSLRAGSQTRRESKSL